MDFTKPEVALRKLRIQLFLPKEFQNKSQMLFMLLLTLRIDQDVVDEYYNELVQIRLAYSVHQIHEYCGCVCQPKRHDQKLIVPISSPKGCLRDILFSNSQLVISRSQINL
ncbi:hypothetical protein Hanom_Chr12g01123131 [Helianthus anomalus]